MRVAYVSRKFGDRENLNGGYSFAAYLAEAFDVELIGIPRQDAGQPELSDLCAYPCLSTVDWSRFDLVLYGEMAFAPFFYLSGVDAALVAHTHWEWPDGQAYVLEAFLPFVERAVCSTEYLEGSFTASGVKAVYAPLVVPWGRFRSEALWSARNGDVIWVGRRGPHKRSHMVDEIATLTQRVIAAWSPSGIDAFAPNVTEHVAEPRDACHAAMRDSRVLLMTSGWETFGLVGVEAGMAGCAVVAPDIPGLRHYGPGAYYFRTPAEAAELLGDGPDALRPRQPAEYWRQRYDVDARAAWGRVLRGEW